MESFSEKEQEQIKSFEQKRKLFQMMLMAHIRLVAAFFVATLTIILLVLYIKAWRSPHRYETQVKLHYAPGDSRFDNTKSLSPKLVLDLLKRKSTRQQFFRELSRDPQHKNYINPQIEIEPIEKNRVIDQFVITVSAQDEKCAVNTANAFAEYCVNVYAKEHSATLNLQRDELRKRKNNILAEIERLDEEKKQLCSAKGIVAPNSEYEQLQRMIHGNQREIQKEQPALDELEYSSKKLKAQQAAFNPALVENEAALRSRITARKKLDDEIERYRYEYTESNTKMINLQDRRNAMEKAFRDFLKEKKISESDVEQLDAAVQLHNELATVTENLNRKRERMRGMTANLKADEDKLAYLSKIMPQIDKLNELQRTQRGSLTKINSSISDIDSRLPLLKEGMRIGGRVESASKRSPLTGKKFVLSVIGALVLSLILGWIIVLMDFLFGVVSGEKELMLLSEMHYLGALPTRNALFESNAQAQIAFNTIYHAFTNVGAQHHIIIACPLPGGKIMPELFEYFERCENMGGNRMLTIDVVLAENFNYDVDSTCDTGIIICSGSKGYLPVISKKFLSPSELELLRSDLLLLRETYDMIVIKHSASMRRDRMFIEQIVPFCDSALIAVGYRKTSRKNLRRIASINKKTGLPIMTILSDNSPDAAGKHNNLEVGA